MFNAVAGHEAVVALRGTVETMVIESTQNSTYAAIAE